MPSIVICSNIVLSSAVSLLCFFSSAVLPLNILRSYGMVSRVDIVYARLLTFSENRAGTPETQQLPT